MFLGPRQTRLIMGIVRRELFEAAASGDLTYLEQFPHNDPVFDKLVTHQESTILHVAVSFRQENFARRVLQLCSRLILKSNARGQTALHVAASTGGFGMTELLIHAAGSIHKDAEESDVDARKELVRKADVQGDTALHIAARKGESLIADLLVGTDPGVLDLVNKDNESPLFIAVERGFHGIARLMVEAYPYAHSGGRNGLTALHAAAIRTCETSFTTWWGSSPWLQKLILALRAPAAGADEEMMRFLLNRRPDLVEKQDEFGWTCLHYVAYYGYLSTARLLIHFNNTSIVYISDDEGLSPLHIAVKKGHINIINEILDFYPDTCDLVDERGRTPLHIAVESENAKVLTHMLKMSKFDSLINMVDKEGNTLLHLAAVCKNPRIIWLLLKDFRIDKQALNVKHLTASNILDSNRKIIPLAKLFIRCQLNRGGRRSSVQSLMAARPRTKEIIKKQNATVDGRSHADGGKPDTEEAQLSNSTPSEPIQKFIHLVKELSQSQFLVATLIATVTFAASITVPGGNTDEGGAVLLQRKSFRVFVVSNGLAFFSSAASLWLQFILSIAVMSPKPHDLLFFVYLLTLVAYSNILAIVAMIVAFTAAICAVLPPSTMLSTYMLAMSVACGGFLFIMQCVFSFATGTFKEYILCVEATLALVLQALRRLRDAV